MGLRHGWSGDGLLVEKIKALSLWVLYRKTSVSITFVYGMLRCKVHEKNRSAESTPLLRARPLPAHKK